MPTKTVSKTIAAPADKVWELFSTFSDLSWMPMPSTVTTDGEGAGMRRHITGPAGSPVTEQLMSIDQAGRTLTYEIQDNNPMPTTSYSSVFSVTGDAEATVTWVVTFEPSDTVAAAEGAIEAIYGAMAQWLADAASTSS